MNNKLQKRSEQVPEDREGGDGRGDGLQGGHACHSHRLKMMGDVLHNSGPPISSEVNVTVGPGGPPHSVHSGGVAAQGVGRPTGGNGTPPSVERLKRRMSGYRERTKEFLPHYESTVNAFVSHHKEDTKKLMKKHVDNNASKTSKSNPKAKKNNSDSKANMKPQLQPQANGLKRPHPGANNAGNDNVNLHVDAKRINLDPHSRQQQAQLQQNSNNTAQSTQPTPTNIKTETKTEPMMHSDQQHQIKSEVINNHISDNITTSDIQTKVSTTMTNANSKLEPSSASIKQESDMANNDVSLNDFELDLENTDFQVRQLT